MSLTPLQPEGWPAPRGYANGMMGEGRILCVGGQIGWDTEGRFPEGFVPQARQALENILAVLRAGGAGPEHIARLTWYVLDIAEYRASLRELGAAYRAVMGKNFPAMALVQVAGLVEPEARLEIEATAIV
ncbi:RidA family protein [Roseomonas sp. GC11]|uniref:RidA family protein n=1 Tax=Roseomonas sp. GC11 TaxID=2950546 RepID=UPI00210B1B92|nr:RidA family protein [Roseomonas sp. GC11]MCQ4158423.1 RidA family protein [Roseomonas sp. GC11]